MDELEQSKQAGTFTISPGKDVYGELTLAGRNTSLYLRDNEYFDTSAMPGQCVKGILHDLTKVTLIQCITKEGLGSARRGDKTYHFASIFPHYVIHGDHHIAPDNKTITEIHFVVDDASTLFYDFDAFGSLIDARPFIEQIVHAKGLERKVTTGPDPQILYFTGKREIFAADTIMGKVSASHNPTHDFGGPDGVRLKNTIFVTIALRKAVTFDGAMVHTFTLLKYLEMLVGRPQNLLILNLRIECNDERPALLRVYYSMPQKRAPPHDEEHPHPADVLLDAVRQPETFSSILTSWLDRQQDWHDARQRFSDSFAQQDYSIDRLIGSANMFDILPRSAVPPDVELSNELKNAKEVCRKVFQELQQSPERDSVLSALGRTGKSTLKHKIRHRGQFLIATVRELFPDLFTVTDEAVNCRNHYVHGTEPKFDYSKNVGTVIFFTDTLEFIFATSDLIEAGWDVTAWSETSMMMSHPFGRYRINYAENLRKLQCLLA
jgi:hypothetical protein